MSTELRWHSVWPSSVLGETSPAYIPSEAQGSEPQNQQIVDEPGGHVIDEDEQPQEVVAYVDEDEPQDDDFLA